MTHLKIELSRNNEEILNNDSVVVKICEIIDNDSLDETSKLTGIIRVPGTYDKYIDKINNNHTDQYNDFEVRTENVYIWFEDPNVEAALKAYYSNITTKGIKASDIGDNNTSWMDRKVFQNRDNNPDANSYGTQITTFDELSKLTNIKLITSFLFNDCSKLRSIDLSNITTFAGNNDGDLGHFSGCTSLTSLGDTTNILNLGPNAAFWNCSSLPSFTLGPSITRIPKNCFYHCTSLTTINGSPQNLQTLGNSCFEGCTSLLNINIDLSNLTSIGSACFKGCSSLLQISLPTNLTSIPSNCFLNCGSLTTVTGLSNITSIINDVFNGCSSLDTVDIDWSKLTSIQDRAFQGCTNLNISIDLSNVTRLGQYAFSNSGITSITLLNQNVNVINSTFYSCTSLTTANNIYKLCNSMFYGCSNLTTVTGLSNITSIPGNAFRSCGNLTSVDIDFQNVTSIESYAFYNCSNLEFNNSLDLSNVTTSIGQNTFYNCTKLVIDEFPRAQRYYTQAFTSIGNTTITIPKEVKQIDVQCFTNCANLTTISFESDSLIISMTSAFKHCPNLTGTVDIPEGFTTSGGLVFYECYKLEHVIYPSTTTSIGKEEFMYDNNLVSITIKAITPPTIVLGTFSHTPDNLIIYVPYESVSAYLSALYWSSYASKIQAIPAS